MFFRNLETVPYFECVVAYFAVVIFERSGGFFLSKNNIDIPGSKFCNRNYEHITKVCTANSAHLSF